MQCKTIITTSGTIEYSIWGIGKPILIIHGGHSNCRERLFHKGIDLKRFRLITPSRPGYGSSLHSLSITPENTASLFMELLTHLEIEKSIIYGVSAGGLTAIALAGIYPERIEKLVLASAVSQRWMSPNDKTYKAAKIIFSPKMESLTWNMIRKISDLAPGMVVSYFHSQFSNKKLKELRPKETFEVLEALKRYRSKQGFVGDLDQQLLNENVFSKINCPTLIIHSEYDNTVPVEHARYANKKIPQSTLIILQNDWGHLLWVGPDSNKNTSLIFNFLKG